METSSITDIELFKQKTIIECLKGLPPQALSEIASYVFFIRKKYLLPREFGMEVEKILKGRIREIRDAELDHLEGEFNDYEKNFPKD